MAPVYPPRSSTPMRCVMNQNRGDPSTYFAGGFQLHQMGTPSVPFVLPSWAFSPYSQYNSLTNGAKHPAPLNPASSLPSPAAAMTERPKGKRGKLPKPVTDYLKDWLHRHSDHPYPSEDEKTQLCEATGLSMSQVSNWMINARRRIFAPAQRAQANAADSSSPFRTPLASNLLLPDLSLNPHHRHYPNAQQHLHPSYYRRASVTASATDLQIHYPMTLQSVPTPAASLQMSHSIPVSVAPPIGG